MSYTKEVIERVRTRNSGEPEFIQAVEEVFFTLDPVLKKHPEWVKANILERITEPERQIMFRVPWTDDDGKLQVNRGYRVQFSGVIGPYKGGLRFHDSLNLGTVKFLGFEQIFKNSLTGLPIGGGKGGSDFSPLGKSDTEIMRFCQSFMTELYRHIGPDIDIPAGDIGVGGKEIGYLYGQYRRIRGSFENGTITGKGIPYGGSHVRPEATGYGIVYFANEILKYQGENFEGKTVALSGFGNVTWGTCLKIRDLGGKVVTISGPDGYVYDPEGIITDEKIDYILEMRSSGRDIVKDYADKFGVEFFPKEKPWGVEVDIVIPCATQNEISIEDAKKIVKNGVKFIIEGSNMPTTNEAIAYLQENSVIVGPAKAANAGGVATSALEMCQNSMRISWNEDEVDKKLMDIMINIHNTAANASEKYGFGYNLVAGANIAGFEKVANAMISQGDY
ncbi:NADP-specific glutamate dehydrogenase [uncultured Ilyobacter sp.]|uniref:NADP-specific glutamate dehydrogenase n=1 Tax=uncultured Ilyobacter sp. TaxID=544433 RepID=UPI0029F47132|nr:NADP-specific glutamate dehydrogenase [uncultured Ilyobacter sp.]